MGRTDNLMPFHKGDPRAAKAGRKGGKSRTGRFKDNPKLARQVAIEGWKKRKQKTAVELQKPDIIEEQSLSGKEVSDGTNN